MNYNNLQTYLLITKALVLLLSYYHLNKTNRNMQTVVDFVFNLHFIVGVAVGYFVVPYLVNFVKGFIKK
jgi:hypothetical protein